MFYDEKKIAEIRAFRRDFPTGEISEVTLNDCLSTLDALWMVARAARRWTLASPGAPAIEAEQDMVDALDAVRDDA